MAKDDAYRMVEEKIERARLKRVRVLDLSGMGLTELPESLGNLSALTHLSLHTNQLSSLPESLGNLSALTSLTLAGNQLSSLPESLGNLSALTQLSLSRNQLSSIPEALGNLPALNGLHLYSNRLSSLPKSIQSMTALEMLDVSGNAIETLPEWIGELTALKNLNLGDGASGGNRLTALPRALARLEHLEYLSLSGNPLTDPPPSIVEQGTQAILAYLREKLEEGERPQWTSKMLLVGEGGVGKTQLLRRLLGKPFEAQSETTHGIDVRALTLAHPTEPGVEMTLNAWDFGGQQIYHATHQFFLTGRSLFLLCWNARVGHEQSKLDYWLDTIHSLAPNAPIMLIATHTDERELKLPYGSLRKTYPQIVGQWAVSCRDTPREDREHDPDEARLVKEWIAGIAKLRDEVRMQAAQLPLMGESWPNSYLDAANAVRQIDETEISKSRLFNLFGENKVTDEKSQETLARALHELGDILWFDDDEELKDVVLLDAEWVDRRVSDVLESEDVIENNGVLRQETMGQLWPDSSEKSCKRMLHLMEKFDLSYEIPDDPNFRSLVVERLAEDPPAEFPVMWESMAPEQGYREVSMRWDLKMRRPAGVPTWFIARTHRFTTNTHWLYGALFADDRDPARRRHLAFVNAPPNERYVELTVRGPSPHAFFARLKDGLELTLDRFPGMMEKLERKVRCSGHDHASCEFMFDYSYLERAMLREPPILEVPCQASFKPVSVPGLLLGIHWTAGTEITRRIEEAEEKILAGQNELKEDLAALLELTQLEFTKLFARDQRLEESHTPSVFSLRPKGRKTWVRKLAGQTWELRLWCEQPGCWHWRKDWPVYEIEDPAKWIGTLAPHLRRLFKVLRFAAPIAGPLTGYAFKEYEAMLKNDIDLMKGLIGGFKELDIDFGTPEGPESLVGGGPRFGEEGLRHGKAESTSLMELRRMLDATAPGWQQSCGLRKILTPENHWLWLCPEHAAEYLI